MLRIKAMRHIDIPFTIRLCDQEKWGVTRDDLERILQLDPKGSFMAYEGARRIGLATSISYGRKLAWIGNVVVDRKFRGKEIGHGLIEHVITYLRERRVRHVALYCFKKNLRFYEGLGFVQQASFARLRRKRKPANFEVSAVSFDHTPKLDRLLAIDRRAFGANRSELIRLVTAKKIGFWIVPSSKSKIKSYMMVRKYEDMCEFGPWISANADRRELTETLRRALIEAEDLPVEISSLRSNRQILTLLREHGFRIMQEGYRMFYGEKTCIGDDRAQCALGFLDKG